MAEVAENAMSNSNGDSLPPGWAEGDLLVGPFHRMVNADMIWATRQYASGAFDSYLGQYVGVVEEKVLATGWGWGETMERAAAIAGVIPARVAVFYADGGYDW